MEGQADRDAPSLILETSGRNARATFGGPERRLEALCVLERRRSRPVASAGFLPVRHSQQICRKQDLWTGKIVDPVGRCEGRKIQMDRFDLYFSPHL
jgi:hypothetical protein